MSASSINSSNVSIINNDELKTSPLLSKADNKIQGISRGKFGDFVQGLANSAIARSFAVSAVAAGTFFLLVSNPVGWMVAAVAAASFALSLLAQIAQKKEMQKASFELTTLVRLAKGKNYDEIKLKDPSGSKIFLGAIPNRLSNDLERLKERENVGAVLSVNEPWEIEQPIGLSNPYQNQDIRELGIDRKVINAEDHKLLEVERLHEAADYIHEMRKQGRNVYVHCRAGAGRSAMAVAAYLIKYQKYTVEAAEEAIKQSRPLSTINKKKGRLQAFAESCPAKK